MAAVTKLNREKRRSLQALVSELEVPPISKTFQSRLAEAEQRFADQARVILGYAVPPTPEEWTVLERWGMEWRKAHLVVLPVSEQLMANAEAWMGGRYRKHFSKPRTANQLVSSQQRDQNARSAWSRLGLHQKISFAVPEDMAIKVPSTHTSGNLFPELPDEEIMRLLKKRIDLYMVTAQAETTSNNSWFRHSEWQRKISALIEMASTLEEVEEFMPEASQIRPENLAESLREMTS
jgi:hypothetical protein